MFERLRKWAVLALVVLALVFSVGFLLGRASVPYPIGAAVSRVPETNTENEKQDAEENEAAVLPRRRTGRIKPHRREL